MTATAFSPVSATKLESEQPQIERQRPAVNKQLRGRTSRRVNMPKHTASRSIPPALEYGSSIHIGEFSSPGVGTRSNLPLLARARNGLPDQIFGRASKADGVHLIVGPRGSGKSTAATRLAETVLNLSKPGTRLAASEASDGILAMATPNP